MPKKKNSIDDLEDAVDWFGKVVVDFETRQEQRHDDEREAAPSYARGSAGTAA